MNSWPSRRRFLTVDARLMGYVVGSHIGTCFFLGTFRFSLLLLIQMFHIQSSYAQAPPLGSLTVPVPQRCGLLP
jgi:hypothetical protein